MQFKELEWRDHISDGVIIGSSCVLRVYDSIKIEFKISYEINENNYYLYSFGIGSMRRLMPDIFTSLDEAKTAAYKIYCNEMVRMKKAIDFLIEDSKNTIEWYKCQNNKPTTFTFKTVTENDINKMICKINEKASYC